MRRYQAGRTSRRQWRMKPFEFRFYWLNQVVKPLNWKKLGEF